MSNFKNALLCATGLVSLTTAAYAQQANNVESVTVTGSRLIQDITLSPTPITAVTADQLAATTPTDIPDALNKLPVFIGGRTPRSQDNGSKNNGGNVLSLRNFGVSRTLVLLDGHRVPASNQDGTVDVDTLPQMLMTRVDVVTGGASAVYGSDAVAGVVNFVLDKKFEGFKYNINAGISKYGDGAQEQAGFAWGTSLFGGRGHFELSGRYYNHDMIPDDHRPYGQNGNSWVLAGSGTAAAPYTNVPYGHTFQQSQNGRIQCGTTCTLNNYTFKDPGIATPMTHGIPTTTSQLEQGGDGGYNPFGTYLQKTQTKEMFSRFSYDLTDDVNAYVQTSWAESNNYANWSPVVVSSSNNRASYFFANNPYLSPATSATLLATGNIFAPAPVVDSRNGSSPPPAPATPIFSAAGYQFNKIDGTDARAQGRIYNTIGVTRNIDVEAGLTGTMSLGFMKNWAWDAYYNHGEDRTTVKNPHNTNNARFLAAEDAVIAPAGTTVNGTSVAGTVVCWVTTQTTYAALYPGCQPINAFNPNGPSAASFDYISQLTYWTLSQNLDDLGGSIHGGLGFGLPAGEVTASVSGEMRWNTYTMQSNASPTDFVNCTGLRLCQANSSGIGSATGPSAASLAIGAPALWTQNVNAPVDVSNNVYEFATEINVPLVKNVPMFQDVSLDVAGRYTNYSTSGEAYTWKVGGDWHLNDTVRFRGTMSVDIRAPNLNDLYAPANISSTGQTDLLTGGNNSTQLNLHGTPNLVPEVAHSYSAGLVLTPDFIPGLSFSVDWYTTHMSNAISQISYQSTSVQNICLASAPTYTNAFCALAVRPITNPADPNYKSSSLNFPSQVFSAPLNTARQYMEGWDIEIDYSWDMDSVLSGIPGTVNFRHLITYQPVNTTIQLPGAAPTWAVAPKTRQTTFLAYQLGDWGLALQNQWLSGMKKASADPSVASNAQIYAQPRISSYNVLDVTIDRKFSMWGGDTDLYLNITNIGNTRAPLYPTNASNPGLFYPIGSSLGSFYDDNGRYFTIGLKGNL
jgi:outer membrane receptor protein involved in Fe transport